jgi:hypothetical protein
MSLISRCATEEFHSHVDRGFLEASFVFVRLPFPIVVDECFRGDKITTHLLLLPVFSICEAESRYGDDSFRCSFKLGVHIASISEFFSVRSKPGG